MVYSQPFQSIQIIVRVAFLPRFAVIAVLFYPFSYSSRIPQYSLKLSEQSESLDLFIQFKERLRKWKLFFCEWWKVKYIFIFNFKGERWKNIFIFNFKIYTFSPWRQISPKVEVVVPWNFHMNWLSFKFRNCRTEKFFFHAEREQYIPVSSIETTEEHWRHEKEASINNGIPGGGQY